MKFLWREREEYRELLFYIEFELYMFFFPIFFIRTLSVLYFEDATKNKTRQHLKNWANMRLIALGGNWVSQNPIPGQKTRLYICFQGAYGYVQRSLKKKKVYQLTRLLILKLFFMFNYSLIRLPTIISCTMYKAHSSLKAAFSSFLLYPYSLAHGLAEGGA